LDEVARVDRGILRFIPLTGEIELKQPARIQNIKVPPAGVALIVTNDPGLRTLGHIADGSVTYLLPPEQARQLAAKHGAEAYMFSHGHNLNFVSKPGPREWIQTAVSAQLTQSGLNIRADTSAADRILCVSVRNLTLKIAGKGIGIAASASVTLDVSITTNGGQAARRDITGQKADLSLGMVGSPGGYAKAFPPALEDALAQLAAFVEQAFADK
jgi:hypothetical protein